MSLARPTPAHLRWADMEYGLLIHADLQTFDPTYDHDVQLREDRDPAIFAPTDGDTDRWAEAAVKGGAKYAVLVCKHCTGYCLWPTKAHDYCIRSSPWKDGKGDLVGDFVASCRKYGLGVGLYYSVNRNCRFGVDDYRPTSRSSLTQEEYNALILTQLTELWTWYGKLDEFWFDAGCLPVAEGGADILTLMKRYQPDMTVFHGPLGTPSPLRYLGNWNGTPVPDCSAVMNMEPEAFFRPGKRDEGPGDPDGGIFAPAEAFMPIRDPAHAFLEGWFWRAGDDDYVISPETLAEKRIALTGSNCNFLIGMVLDDRGLFPDRDCEVLAEAGHIYDAAFSEQRRIASDGLSITVPSDRAVDYIVIAEDITEGERVRGFELLRDGAVLASGTVIGHKRIIPTGGLKGGVYTLRITAAAAEPLLRDFAAY